MANSTRDASSIAEALSKKVPVIFLLVREDETYKARRRWGIFDVLGVRAIDDLTFGRDEKEKTVFAFTQEPHHASDTKVISLPTQVALERIFFHIQGVSTFVLDPGGSVSGCAQQQSGVEFTAATASAEERRIGRGELPEAIGAYMLPKRKIADALARAARAFKKNSLFESLYLARQGRKKSEQQSLLGWYYELMSLSFMGLPDEALSLYEEYLQQASNEPHAQLIGARYRLLLRQFNEARTILHTLSFHEELGVVASCELARSYLLSGEFDRAIDIASGALKQDASFCEAYLVRGIAQRGLSYHVGDEDGLRDALKDLEKVATIGGFNAPEALFHAGTIFGRLGALEQAEVALRQSLFQRDRYASRDALVRVLCAQSRASVAREELNLLSALMQGGTEELRQEVESHLSKGGHMTSNAESDPSNVSSALEWASQSLREWRIPVRSTLGDFALIDDFISRFAPAGEFMESGEFLHLHSVENQLIVRALSLHLGAILVNNRLADWESGEESSVRLRSKKGLLIPIEHFVQERILLGASGDNLSSLDSLLSDAEGTGVNSSASSAGLGGWWREAGEGEIVAFKEHAAWTRVKLKELGSGLTGTLRDFEEIDRVIEEVFEPGGVLKEIAHSVIGNEVDKFVVGLGLLVGETIARLISLRWYTHELPEGISVVAEDLGRIFPVARLQRRVYLSSAAEASAKLESFAFGIAAAIISQGVRSGVYKDTPHVVTALRDLLPRLSEFSDSEIEGVADTILRSGKIP